MRTFIIILFFIAFPNIIFSQNLLPNGSFESTTDLNYADPYSAFLHIDDWYAANYYSSDTLYEGTPDLFDANNHLPLTDPPNFWNIAYGAADGDFHVGIANHVKYEGYFQPEALGVRLIQPLEAKEYYHVEFQVRNKGISAYLNHVPIVCVSGQHKRIDILLDTDSIFVLIDEPNKDSYSNASKVATLFSKEMESQFPVGWQKTGTCFQADGGEQFLAIAMASGRFSVDPPCLIHDDHWDAFYLYYFDIDDMKLTRLPNEFTFKQSICTGQKTKINIADLVNLPVMQKEIEYHWSDGRIDSINHISKAGTYFIDAVIDCKTIPITLEVTEFECKPDIFVPNIFSPNGDGINDQLEIFISADLPIKGYEFCIFNRWGSKIFSTKDSNTRWDGTFGGKIMDEGVYIWLLEYSIDDIEFGIKGYKKSGDVMLVR